MYTIRYDPVRRIVHLKLDGFWTIATVVAFGAELLLRVTAIRLRYRRFALLSNASTFPVQSATVSTYFERIMARGIALDVGAVRDRRRLASQQVAGRTDVAQRSGPRVRRARCGEGVARAGLGLTRRAQATICHGDATRRASRVATCAHSGAARCLARRCGKELYR